VAKTTDAEVSLSPDSMKHDDVDPRRAIVTTGVDRRRPTRRASV